MLLVPTVDNKKNVNNNNSKNIVFPASQALFQVFYM